MPQEEQHESHNQPSNLEILRPSQAGPAIEKPTRKHHGFRNFLIVILIILLAVVIGVGTSGLYTVPVVSSVLGADKPKDLGIKASQAALTSLEQKIPVKVQGGPNGFCLGCNETYTGQIHVDTQRTSEEITSFLQLFPRGNNAILKDTQVRFIEGGMEISSKLDKPIHAPVYVKVLVARASNRSVTLSIVNAKIGFVSVPEKYTKLAQDAIQKIVNDRLAVINGYSIEKLEYHDGYSYFKGTYPATVAPAPGKWLNAL